MRRHEDPRATEAAELLAIQALAFLAQDPERLERFLNETGISIDTLRAEAGDPQMLAAIMDFVIAFDDRLLAFAEQVKLKPASIIAARRRLPGAAPEW